MKTLFTIILTLFILNSYSQNYKLIDEKVKNYPKFNQIDELVSYVNTNFNSDIEKVRAFYTWSAYNITYDLNTFNAIKPKTLGIVFDSARLNKSIENQKIKKTAEKVFKNRKALCLGFSYLFRELCLKSNIEVKIIKGITKTSANNIENPNYLKNHAWNAVKINNKWKLIDVTFSSGYLNNTTGKWVKFFNDFYFFTNPKKFLTSHLPAQAEFQFIANPLSTEDFFSRPIYYRKYFESGLQLSDSQSGLLQIIGNSKKVSISFKSKNYNGTIYYKFNNESTLKRLSLTKNDMNNYIAYLKCKSKRSKFLSLYYKNEKILDFKIEG
ncbi:transglutaminase domain-containing protein [uncultured Winogradskyella sp.]|uniref:transglutaminase domain-containing protein n=1 Tax=uncultured Winogradskyella sp. TaxID=395353 RepID=UPI00261D1EDD|nr:transglutaminase domain-containing protein [uncultured Winogradskyella sp.]